MVQWIMTMVNGGDDGGDDGGDGDDERDGDERDGDGDVGRIFNQSC